MRLFNSGLAVFSRFPIVAVQFVVYTRAAKEDALACKGVLLAKVVMQLCLIACTDIIGSLPSGTGGRR